MKKTIAIIAFGLLGLSLSAQIPNYVPSNALLGWWPFNGNANDYSLNANNGTVNGATLTTDRFGNANFAYSFNGTSNFIRCLNAGPTGNPTITASFWMRTNQTSYGHIIGYGNNGINGADFRVLIAPSTCSGTIQFDIFGSVLAKSDTQNNTWDFYTVIYDGSLGSNTSITKIYKNGALLSTTCNSTNITATNISNLIPITFGRYHGTVQTGFYNGALDDIGMWNRALTQQEITNLYTATNCANNITISPQTNSLPTGSTATFTATTSDPNPGYVWQSNLGQGFQTLNNFGNYSGVNTASLNIGNVQLSNHNQPIRVISTSGNCIDTSNVAVINILDTCIVTINDTITTLISVTDTLIINTTVTGLTPPNNLNTIKVFPNPAYDHITINYGNFALMSGYTLKITNNLGQVVFTSPINQQSSYIDLSTWTGNGIYFVQIIDTQNNTIENRKIVIQ
jgi:hypothetical protein